MPRCILTANDIMREGLLHMGFCVDKQARRSCENNWNEYKRHYGPSPSAAALIWDDLCTTDIPESKLSDNEKGQKGLKFFHMALYFLYNYPRSAYVLASRFDVAHKNAGGDPLWKWVSRVAGLRAKVIKFPEEFSDPNGREFAMTLDCRDQKCWEKKHPRYNLDRSYSSIKHGMHAGLKHEIGLSIYHDQICWLNGPFKATMHDITVFRRNLKAKWLSDFTGKYIVVDLGYRTSEPNERMLAYPSSIDPLVLSKMKSMSRCRQEDLNARFAKFKCLAHEFEHSEEKHGQCYAAVAVVIQYQFNCGDAYLPKIW